MLARPLFCEGSWQSAHFSGKVSARRLLTSQRRAKKEEAYESARKHGALFLHAAGVPEKGADELGLRCLWPRRVEENTFRVAADRARETLQAAGAARPAPRQHTSAAAAAKTHRAGWRTPIRRSEGRTQRPSRKPCVEDGAGLLVVHEVRLLYNLWRRLEVIAKASPPGLPDEAEQGRSRLLSENRKRTPPKGTHGLASDALQRGTR